MIKERATQELLPVRYGTVSGVTANLSGKFLETIQRHVLITLTVLDTVVLSGCLNP